MFGSLQTKQCVAKPPGTPYLKSLPEHLQTRDKSFMSSLLHLSQAKYSNSLFVTYPNRIPCLLLQLSQGFHFLRTLRRFVAGASASDATSAVFIPSTR